MKEKYLLNEARRMAKEFGHPYIGTEHIVGVMLHRSQELQEKLGISYWDYCDELMAMVGEGQLSEDKAATKRTPMLDKLLEQTKPFNIDDFMVNMANENEGIAMRILNELDIDADFILQAMSKTKLPKELLKHDCLVNLNEKVANKGIHIFNVKEKTDELINNLFKVRKPNVMLVGKAGCGKSALVEGLAERINGGNVPEFMKDKVIFEMTVSNAVAGTKYRGEFEQKIKEILTLAEQCPQVILFIDEAHTIMNAGGAEGAVAMGDILKPYLARGTISLIGATTDEEFKIIEKDKAMQRRFTVMNLLAPNEEDIRDILKGWASKFEEHYNVTIEDETIRAIIAKCRKDKTKTSPDKELDALENWCLEHCNWRAVEWKELVSNK